MDGHEKMWVKDRPSRMSLTHKSYSCNHLQNHLNFLTLKLNSPDDWFEKLLCYSVSG
jgi:hypothetical protein